MPEIEACAQWYVWTVLFCVLYISVSDTAQNVSQQQLLP